MALHKIEKGLDLPIPGKPLQVIREAASCTRVAVVADEADTQDKTAKQIYFSIKEY